MTTVKGARLAARKRKLQAKKEAAARALAKRNAAWRRKQGKR